MPKGPVAAEYEALRQILVEARRKSGLTQAELAKAIGGSQSFVSKYEAGERGVDVGEFVRIALALKAHPARLIKTLKERIRRRN